MRRRRRFGKKFGFRSRKLRRRYRVSRGGIRF